MDFMKRIWAVIAFAIILAVSGVATEASAKTNLETVACRDAGFAALPFSGTPAEKEVYATKLPVGTEVLVDGIMVPLAKGQSLWSRCMTGPTPLEVANARIKALEADNATLDGYINGPGGWRELLKTANDTVEARDETIKTRDATIKTQAATIKRAKSADWLQNGLFILAFVAFLIACFRRHVSAALETLAYRIRRWNANRKATKARKLAAKAAPAPAAPSEFAGDA